MLRRVLNVFGRTFDRLLWWEFWAVIILCWFIGLELLQVTKGIFHPTDLPRPWYGVWAVFSAIVSMAATGGLGYLIARIISARRSGG